MVTEVHDTGWRENIRLKHKMGIHTGPNNHLHHQICPRGTFWVFLLDNVHETGLISPILEESETEIKTIRLVLTFDWKRDPAHFRNCQEEGNLKSSNAKVMQQTKYSKKPQKWSKQIVEWGKLNRKWMIWCYRFSICILVCGKVAHSWKTGTREDDLLTNRRSGLCKPCCESDFRLS